MKTDWTSKRNLSMLTDFYEFTMGNAFLETDMDGIIAYFDMFFRNVPDEGGFAIAAGLEQMVEYIQNLKFTEEDIDYLRSKNLFSEKFLDYLRHFQFTGDIWAVPEGTVVFPKEPLVTVRAPIMEAQLMETMILISVNHQSLIATKTNRIVRAANGRPVMEFGSRRAQGADGAVLGARASYIAGAAGTANTLADSLFGSPALGTMAHSMIMLYNSEYEAFKAFARTYPDNCTLLVDTYDTLRQGIPNAIRVFDEILKPIGKRPKGIRIDSGDIAYLSKEARKLLDEAGYPDCGIVASNSLDEYKIRELLVQGAKLDSFGVGERLITAKSEPVFGGVYKLVAVEDTEGNLIPKIKISENVSKITLPGFKNIIRFYDKNTHHAEADLIILHDEEIQDDTPIEIFDPIYTWKRRSIKNFYTKKLMVPIFQNGKLVYDLPDLQEIRKYCMEEVDRLWDEVKRFDRPHLYIVDYSQNLWEMQQKLLANHKGGQA